MTAAVESCTIVYGGRSQVVLLPAPEVRKLIAEFGMREPYLRDIKLPTPDGTDILIEAGSIESVS